MDSLSNKADPSPTSSQAKSPAAAETVEFFKMLSATLEQEVKVYRDKCLRLQLQIAKNGAENAQALVLRSTQQEPNAPNVGPAEQAQYTEKDLLIARLQARIARLERDLKFNQDRLSRKDDAIDHLRSVIACKENVIEDLHHKRQNDRFFRMFPSQQDGRDETGTPAEPLPDSEEQTGH